MIPLSLCSRTHTSTPLSHDKVHPSWVGSKGYKKSGACTAIWTGLTDIEAECDGFLTYDRRASKYDEARIKDAIEALKAA